MVRALKEEQGLELIVGKEGKGGRGREGGRGVITGWIACLGG